MSARAVLAPRVNSHPFQERSVSLDQPLKIGRSVARSRPGASNAIFDCKVLSRNHALMWYEAGKFYLQDTKSSNGTFVNNVRLSKSSEESPPTQITSGDVLQFGVDVMELTKKVTHGCIVATLQLFTPDGKEAKGPALSDKPPTTLQDVYALNQFIREAAEREEKLESKINEMNAILSQTNEALEAGWKALIEEDRLLTRVDILERQLQACHKSMTEDKLRVEVVELLSDKENYQEAAKEALRKSLAEKAEALKRQQELERTLRNGEDEREFLRETAEKAKEELEKLAVKHEVVEKNLVSLQEEMSSLSQGHKDDLDTLHLKLKEDQDALKDKEELITELLAKVQEPPFTQPFQNEVSMHNHNDEDAGSENEKEGLSLDVTRVDKGDTYEINEELSELRKKLKQVEADKSNICARLVHIQEMFALVHVSVNNNPYTEGNLKAVVNKVEIELRQMKNTSAFLEPKSPPDHDQDYGTIIQPQPSHPTPSSPDECDENQKEASVKIVSQNEFGLLQKLLDDARHTIVVLEQKLVSQETEYDHKINLIRALKREKGELETSQEKMSVKILELQEQLDALELARTQTSLHDTTLVQDDELESREKKSLSSSPEITHPSSLDPNPGSEFSRVQAQEVRGGAKDEVEPGKAPTPAPLREFISEETRIPDLKKTNDLNSREHDAGPQSAKQSVVNGSVSLGQDLGQESRSNEGIRERLVPGKQLLELLEVDEELGLFKEHHARLTQENECLKRELAQLQNVQENTNKRLLMLLPFFLVLFLAVLIVFNPLK